MDGNGKGDYWPGAPGWGSTNMELVKAKSYGFPPYFEPMQVSGGVFKAQLKSIFRKEKGLLFYYWSPKWLFAEYDLRQLQEPSFDGYAMDSKKDDPQYKLDGCWKMYQSTEADDWLAKSEVKCAW